MVEIIFPQSDFSCNGYFLLLVKCPTKKSFIVDTRDFMVMTIAIEDY